jgi:hypothetical protein
MCGIIGCKRDSTPVGVLSVDLLRRTVIAGRCSSTIDYVTTSRPINPNARFFIWVIQVKGFSYVSEPLHQDYDQVRCDREKVQSTMQYVCMD